MLVDVGVARGIRLWAKEGKQASIEDLADSHAFHLQTADLLLACIKSLQLFFPTPLLLPSPTFNSPLGILAFPIPSCDLNPSVSLFVWCFNTFVAIRFISPFNFPSHCPWSDDGSVMGISLFDVHPHASLRSRDYLTSLRHSLHSPAAFDGVMWLQFGLEVIV